MAKKIKSVKDLMSMRDKVREEVDLRSGPKEVQVTVHMGTCGIAAGARDVLAALVRELDEAGAQNATLRQAGCAGLCDREPMLTVTDKSGGQVRYGKLDGKKVHRIVQEHLVGGTPVVEFLISE
ncbi:MAG: (2Fe-2S) ferredoxin domain-containing protein [Candidatus Hydrogenedentes bacterium]|nr:(2Fe-2S) ferredoxin domain-containing protein [Candidatus Hydrogenedentota bacterium]